MPADPGRARPGASVVEMKAPAGPGKTAGLSKPWSEIDETPKNQSSMITSSILALVSFTSRNWVHCDAVLSRHQTL
jgi:hypothetical protein